MLTSHPAFASGLVSTVLERCVSVLQSHAAIAAVANVHVDGWAILFFLSFSSHK
jgi:hypothetical protein